MNEAKRPWETLNKKIIYDNPWIHVEEHAVINPSGKESIYGVVQYKSYALGILPVDNEGYIYLIGQHRYPFNEYTWEIPEGGGSINEDPLANAKRELLEEAGIIAEKWELIQEIQLSNSVSDEYGFIYLAQQLSYQKPEPDEDEDLVIKKIKFSEAYSMIERGIIKDSLTVIALLKGRLLGFG
ncbi:MAG: NUDIX domain-containing protein [Chitinophagales bacterium]